MTNNLTRGVDVDESTVDGFKRCNLCSESKPHSEFYANSGTRDGLGSCCKRCSIEKARRSRLKNPERAREHARASRERNRDKIRARNRAHYWADVETSRDRSQVWAAANREYFKAWRIENAEYMSAHYKAKRAHRRSALIGEVDLAALWTGFCGICGDELNLDLKFPDSQSKSVDHIVPLSKGGSHSQDNLQWAHLGCNAAKGAR